MESYWFIYYTYELDGKCCNGNTCLHDSEQEYFRATLAMAHIEDLLSTKHKESEGMKVAKIVIAGYQRATKKEVAGWEEFYNSQKTV